MIFIEGLYLTLNFLISLAIFDFSFNQIYYKKHKENHIESHKILMIQIGLINGVNEFIFLTLSSSFLYKTFLVVLSYIILAITIIEPISGFIHRKNLLRSLKIK